MIMIEDCRTKTKWQTLLDREVPALNLPTDYPRPSRLSSDVAMQTVALSETLVQQLKALVLCDDRALAPVLLAAFQVLLYRYSGQEDILISSPVAELHTTGGASGSYAGWMVVRADLSDVAGCAPTFRTLFLQTSRELVDAAVGPLPLGESCAQVAIGAGPGRAPLFQAGWLYRSGKAAPTGDARLPHWTGLEIALLLEETGSGLSASFIYSTDLFSSATVARMAGHYQTLLAGIAADPDRSIALLPLLTPAERHRIVVEWNQIRTDYPRDKCIQQLFEAQVEYDPEATAIVFAKQRVTYGELNRRANQLAHYLQSLEVGPDTLVGICAERSIEMIVGILGILKAGGAYVPLDPNYPQERLAFMADDARLSAIVTQEKLVKQLPDCQAERVCIDKDWRQIAGQSTENPVCPVTAGHLAYVMYTSGSTGIPKGASIAHRSVVRLVKETNYARLTAAEVFLQYAPISFDAATLELWGSLLNGGVLVVPPPHNLSLAELGEIVREHGVTILWLTAGLFHLMVDECLEDLRTVQQLLSGGDVLSVPHVRRVLATIKGCTLINGYGPTENTTFTCCYPMTSMEQVGASVSIGRPIANTSVYILDRHLQPVPVGVPGELYTGGDGLAREYHNRPRLTAEKFIPNPFGEGRLYRTGDLVQYLPDGNIEFLGRIDDQVKVRGYRIELGEIEAVLERHPAVQQAVVLALADQEGDKRLAAYLTLGTEMIATGARGEKDAEEHVALWQALYEETYRQTSTPDDPTFHAAWWTSSYTGQPIAAAEMHEWVDRTVACILALQPRCVLEIGCGTGMLLARVAPHCTTYVGIDFSRTALDHIRTMKQMVAGLDHIRLLERAADDLADLTAQSFDTIVINSVTQHFPDVEYLLRVLRGAVRLVRSGGHILVGDVSNLALLETFHSSVQCYRATDAVTCAQLRQRIRQQVVQERDLQIDPAFFLALQEQLPEITQVQVMPKRGRYDNQLTRFRYEAILRIGESACGAHDEALQPVRDLAWVDWQRDKLTLADIQRILTEQRPLTLAIRTISNARLARDVAAMHWLQEAAPDETTGRLRAFLARQPTLGLDPEDLWALEQELPYHIELSWLNAGTYGVYDALFTHKSLPHRPAVFAQNAPYSPLAKYANHPQRATKHGQVILQVREFLQEKLPDHMVPATFAVLDKLPLSPNGKIDRRALAQLGLEEESLAKTTFVPSHNPVEKMLVEMWADVLNLKHVGLEDDFFALGGNSLKAMALVNRLQRRLNRAFRPLALFHAATVAQFAAYLQEQYPDLPVQLAAVGTEGNREEGEI
jgi:amino acid adenylation domain-containing protein